MKIEFRFTSFGFAVLEFTKVNPMVASWAGASLPRRRTGILVLRAAGGWKKARSLPGSRKVHAASDFTITS